MISEGNKCSLTNKVPLNSTYRLWFILWHPYNSSLASYSENKLIFYKNGSKQFFLVSCKNVKEVPEVNSF